MVKASADRAIPIAHVGTIEPNYYCRGWNAKRQKYCKAIAGWGTTHPGVGRCKNHGGMQEHDGRVKHGRFATVHTAELREMMAQIADQTDPLDVIEELLLAKAYLRKLVADGVDIAKVPQVESLVDTISKVTHRVQMARAAYALSRPEFLRIMTEMGRQVEAHASELGRELEDDTEHQLDVGAAVNATLKRIRDGWLSIRF